MNLNITEQEMLQAFGMAPVRPRAKAIGRPDSLMVTLSVRDGLGPPKRFTHRAYTISRTQAQIEAERAARSMGLTPWALLEITAE